MIKKLVSAPADGRQNDIPHDARNTSYLIPQNSILTFYLHNLASGNNNTTTPDEVHVVVWLGALHAFRVTRLTVSAHHMTDISHRGSVSGPVPSFFFFYYRYSDITFEILLSETVRQKVTTAYVTRQRIKLSRPNKTKENSWDRTRVSWSNVDSNTADQTTVLEPPYTLLRNPGVRMPD